MTTDYLDELIEFARSMGPSNIDTLVLTPATALEIFGTTFITHYQGWNVLILEGKAAVTITNKKTFLENHRVHFPDDLRYPTTEGGPTEIRQLGLDPGDHSHQDLQDQDRALAAAREILSQGTDLQAAPGEAGTVSVPALVRPAEIRGTWIDEASQMDRDQRRGNIVVGILALILAAIALLTSGCVTATDQAERWTISYELTTGTKGTAAWILPKDAKVTIQTSRGDTWLEWRKGQSMSGVLKHNVVDYRIEDRTLTGETYVNEDAPRQNLILVIGGLVMAGAFLALFWGELKDGIRGKG